MTLHNALVAIITVNLQITDEFYLFASPYH